MRGVNQDIIETPGIQENKDRCYREAGYLLGTPDIELGGDICKQARRVIGVLGGLGASASLIQSKYCAATTHTRAAIKYHMTYGCCYPIKYAVIPGVSSRV